MKSRTLKIFGLCLIFLFFSSALGMAIGFGAYASYDVLLGSLGLYNNPNDFNRIKIIQFGLVMDTNVAEDRLFNYRLQIGLDLSNATYNSTSSATPVSLNIWQLRFINTFGFGVIRTDALRFWFGPQVGIGFGFEPTFANDTYYSSMGNFLEFDIFLGPVVGLNINLGDTISLCADLGLRIHEDIMAAPGASTMFIGYLIKAYANLGVIFRFNDNYDE
jgi:hypothetical protein